MSVITSNGLRMLTAPAGLGLSMNTAYRVLHRQKGGLLTLEGYLMLVDDDQVRQATSEQVRENAKRYGR